MKAPRYLSLLCLDMERFVVNCKNLIDQKEALLEENPDIMVVVTYAWGRKKYLFVAKVFR